MWNWLKPKYNGAHVDLRSDDEKAKDWQAREIFAFGIPEFRTVKEGEWKRYSVRNQDGSGSCVANSQAKFLEIMAKRQGKDVVFSHAPVYINRANKPGSGMGYPNCAKLQTTINTCPESDIPSQNLSDEQLDAIKLPPNYEDLNDLVKPTGYVVLPLAFYDVGSYVEQYGAAIIWIDSDYSNWNKDIPTVGGKGGGVRHSICVVDAVNFNGTDYLVIEDSWGSFGKYNGQRLITREFFKDAVFMAYAFTTFEYQLSPTSFEPFRLAMQLYDAGSEVTRLQKYLRAQGFFPKNVVTSGYYGNITAQAVLAFQIKFNVDKLPTLMALKGKNVGPKTLAAINAHLTV